MGPRHPLQASAPKLQHPAVEVRAASAEPSKDIALESCRAGVRWPSEAAATSLQSAPEVAAELRKPCRNPAQERHQAGSVSVSLDMEVFRNFWPLLEACRDYARMSGCRFRSNSFDGLREPSHLAEDEASRESEEAVRLTAKLHAVPAVREFAQRLQSGEQALVEELEKAFRMQLAEGTRNSMISTCQALEMWPPATPPGIPPDDRGFEDVSAALPVIAQRLYNDEMHREETATRTRRMDPVRRRALMAAFLVDFASVHDIPLPDVPETYTMMLADFRESVSAWEEAQTAGFVHSASQPKCTRESSRPSPYCTAYDHPISEPLEKQTGIFGQLTNSVTAAVYAGFFGEATSADSLCLETVLSS